MLLLDILLCSEDTETVVLDQVRRSIFSKAAPAILEVLVFGSTYRLRLLVLVVPVVLVASTAGCLKAVFVVEHSWQWLISICLD